MRLCGLTISCLTIILLSVTAKVTAGPLIEVSQDFVGNQEPIAPGGFWSASIAVTNAGDAPLSVTEIGSVEMSPGPRGWLSVSETQLYILPGQENSVEFDIEVNAAAYDFPIDMLGYVYLRSDAENNDSLVMTVWVWVGDPAQVIFWNIIQTDWRLYMPMEVDAECVGLVVSSHGAVGTPGWRQTHLDYFASGFECGTRDTDQVYLNSGSPYVLIDDGESVSLTASINQSGTEREHDWLPAAGSSDLEGGFHTGYGSFEYVRTAQLLNRDGRIGMERTYFAPHTPPGHLKYIIAETKIYSADGQPHSHVTIGSVVDWDIPSDIPVINTSGVSVWRPRYGLREFTYVQGTDTAGSIACQPSTSRFGAEVFLFGSKKTPVYTDYFGDIWGTMVGSQSLLTGSSKSGDGSLIAPTIPDGRAWLDEIAANPGYNSDPTPYNQVIWTTWLHDFDLAGTDTLTFVTALTTVRDGTPNNLAYNAKLADLFYEMAIRGLCCACCLGQVGDANNYGTDEPTVADVSVMIDALFITGSLSIITCLDEADINQDGGCCSNSEHVTITDIAILIDYLFITGPSLGLPPCEW